MLLVEHGELGSLLSLQLWRSTEMDGVLDLVNGPLGHICHVGYTEELLILLRQGLIRVEPRSDQAGRGQHTGALLRLVA